MYRHLYGLKDKPFQISTDPAFLWLGQKHDEALAVLVYGVRNSKGFLLLSGGVGTGKTTLIHALLGQLDNKVTVATMHDPGLTTMDFFNFIATAYGIRKRYTNKVDFLFDFEKLLRKIRAAGRTALLIVDEAQRLDQTLLEEIRLLSNIEDPDQKLLNVFFVGQEEFLEIISDPQNRALKQRITINYHLETLSMEETEQLVRHRLKVAGATREVFTPDAFPGIFKFSLGAPRRINILCDHALLTGFVHNVDTIGADIIAECTQDLMLPGEQPHGLNTAPPASVPEPAADPKPTTATVTAGIMLQNAPLPRERKKWPWAMAAILLLAIGIGFVWQRGWWPLTQSLNTARVTPSAPIETTAPEASTPRAPATSTPSETLDQPTAPTTNVSEPSPAPIDTPDTAEPTSLPAVPEAEPPTEPEVREPHPPANIATPHPMGTPMTGSSSETSSVLETPEAIEVADIDQPLPETLVVTAPNVRAPIDSQKTNDALEAREPSPIVNVPPVATATIANSTVPPPTESLPDAVRPSTTPPTDPVTVASTEFAKAAPSPLATLPKPEPTTASILGLPPAATPATTAEASLPYPTEDKIQGFLRAYCNAYQSRDINRFRLFFAEDAIEMNRPILSALPVYQKNFNALAALNYAIDLKAWEEDEATGQVTLRGRFDIRYRMSDSAWRSTQGDIRMDLVETQEGVYRIKRLDYWKE